jgi:hypothetical protein
VIKVSRLGYFCVDCYESSDSGKELHNQEEFITLSIMMEHGIGLWVGQSVSHVNSVSDLDAL